MGAWGCWAGVGMRLGLRGKKKVGRMGGLWHGRMGQLRGLGKMGHMGGLGH